MSDKPAKPFMKIAIACILAGAATVAAAQTDDPLKSPACGQALASLQSARASGAPAPAVEALRSEAASSCLGSGAVPQRPGRVVQPPVAVPPPQIDLPTRAAPLAPPVLPPPAVAIERPATPALCDPGGCWTSDGMHLRHVGPSLMGPNGLCMQQGGVVSCP